MRNIALILLAVAIGAAAEGAEKVPVATAKAIELVQTDGAAAHPLGGDDGAVVVVIFGSVDCPIANAEIPEVRRIHAKAIEVGAKMFFVHPRRLQPLKAMGEHAAVRKLKMPVLHDAHHALVGLLNATTTPEAFVLRRDGDAWTVVYRGLIDNLYADVGRRRRNASKFFVRDAISAAVARTPIEMPVRPPLGCLIERGAPK